jgi:hypothetical protein
MFATETGELARAGQVVQTLAWPIVLEGER